MTELGQWLDTNEKEGLRAFVDALHVGFDFQVHAAWLFGSKARGDSAAYSGIDVLVVIEHLTPQARWRIREIAADYSLEYDVLINTHILATAAWQKHVEQHSTLWREIQRDGIQLTTDKEWATNSSGSLTSTRPPKSTDERRPRVSV